MEKMKIEIPNGKTFLIKTSTNVNDEKNNLCIFFDIEEAEDESILNIGTLQKGPGLNTSIHFDNGAILDDLTEGVYTLYVKEARNG